MGARITTVNCVLNISFTRNNGVSWYLSSTTLPHLGVLYPLKFSALITAPDCRHARTHTRTRARRYRHAHTQVEACAIVSDKSAKGSAPRTHAGRDMHIDFICTSRFHNEVIFFFLSSVLLTYSIIVSASQKKLSVFYPTSLRIHFASKSRP